jgi:hypothetical protein
MSNNSWKQYGGISKMDDFNVINASTIVAEQFVSRSTKPIYQYLNGIFEVSYDLSAGQNVIASNSIYAAVDLFINKDIYSNNKIFFGGDTFAPSGNVFPALPDETTHAFMYGDSMNIGVNLTVPKTIFNITGTVEADTDILTVESKNGYIRNILGQNKLQRGLVMDASDSTTNIMFYNDNSTNVLNNPDATIRYTEGGVLSTTTSNGITTSSRYTRIDTSGGTIFMDGTKTQIDSLGYIIMNTSGGFMLDTSYAYVHINDQKGDINIDSSGQFVLHNSGGYFALNDNEGILSSSGKIVVNASGGLIELTSNGGDINLDSQNISLKSFVNFAPPTRESSDDLYHETLTVYDNSHSTFLYNVYEKESIKTGNAIVGVGKDSSANTFLRLVPNGKLEGSAYGGGVYPYDMTRPMNLIGLNDASGNYVHNQMILSGNNKANYTSTLGINTYMPKTEQYVVDMNGPLRIANGEINTIINTEFQIITVAFCKTNSLVGIAVGTPSVLNDKPDDNPTFTQVLLYTNDGGKSWQRSNIYNNDTIDDILIHFNTAFMYNDTYGIIAGNNSYIYYTNNGGINWYRMQYYINGSDTETDNTYRNAGNINYTISGDNLRISIAYAIDGTDDYTKQIRFFDISVADLPNQLNGDTYKLNAFTDISLDMNITNSDSTSEYIYYVGNGIARIKSSALVDNDTTYSNDEFYVVNTTRTYYGIYAYDNNYAIAVGEDIISYTLDGLNWTDIVVSTDTSLGADIILKGIFIHNEMHAVIVGDNGIFLYTSFGPSAANWTIVPDTILNSSGTASRINGNNNMLNTIFMPNKYSYIISIVVTESINDIEDSADIVGESKIQYVFLPALYYHGENTVLDICGNMNITGSINVLSNGLNVNSINYASSLSDSGTMSIANNTHVLNIGKNDDQETIESSINRSFATVSSVINIGANDCTDSNNSVLINIGNYNQNANDRSPNYINIGGGTDKVNIGGKITYSSSASTETRSNEIVLNNLNVNNGISDYIGDYNYTPDSNTQLPDGVTLYSAYDSTKVSDENNYKYSYDTSGDIDSLLDASINSLSSITQPEISNMIFTYINNYNYSDTNLPDGVTIEDDEYVYDNNANNAELENYFISPFNAFNSSARSGLYITDNLVGKTGFIAVSEDMSGYIIKPTNVNSNTIKLDVNSLTLTPENNISVNNDLGIHNINNGIVVLQRSVGSDAYPLVDSDFTLSVKQFDISNILVRDSIKSTDERQFINTETTFESDVSMNSNLLIAKDLVIQGNLKVEQYSTETIINTNVNNYSLIVTEDMSLNGRLHVNGDVSLNGQLFVRDYLGVNINNPSVAVDINYTDAIRIPHGTTVERPTVTDEETNGGYIRYNTTTHQFEGYGPGNAWRSLNGVVNVAQNTKIAASSPNADSTNNELIFYTAPTDDIDPDSATERMRINAIGNVGIGTNDPKNKLDIEGATVIGSTYAGTDVAPTNGLLVEGNVGIGTNDPKNKLDIEGATVIGSTYAGTNTAPTNGLLVEGNVGIGETDPLYKLHIRGSGPQLFLEGDDNVDNPTTIRSTAGPSYRSTYHEIQFSHFDVLGFDGVANYIDFNVSSGGVAPSTRMRIDGNGNVGIGITELQNVKNRLDISGAVTIGSTYAGTDVAPTNGLLVEGNVGIGSNDPKNKLDIEGAVVIGSTYAGTEVAPTDGLLVKGNVFVGTTNSGYTMDINGTVQATSYNATSDLRMKTNIVPMMNSLDKVVKLEGVQYNWKNDNTNKMHSGLIAQSVELIIPEAVETNSVKNTDGFYQKSINYNGIVPYLIESIKTLHDNDVKRSKEFEELKQHNNTLSKKIIEYDKIFDQLMNK